MISLEMGFEYLTIKFGIASAKIRNISLNHDLCQAPSKIHGYFLGTWQVFDGKLGPGSSWILLLGPGWSHRVAKFHPGSSWWRDDCGSTLLKVGSALGFSPSSSIISHCVHPKRPNKYTHHPSWTITSYHKLPVFFHCIVRPMPGLSWGVNVQCLSWNHLKSRLWLVKCTICAPTHTSSLSSVL